mmetsp:Transcript_17178/g.30813  ORF Transcript_17178/g.30813 Transcript_17178/m.30813 type:complete len:490 (-) Transcript_17178:100-1569(-)
MDEGDIVEPPPGWKRAVSPSGQCEIPRSKRLKREAKTETRRAKWTSVGYGSQDMLRAEILFELHQLINLASDEEISEACRSRDEHDRKKNPWRPISGPLNRIDRLMASKGKLSQDSPSQLLLRGDGEHHTRLRRNLHFTLRTLDSSALMVLHENLTAQPKLAAKRVCEVDSEEFLPIDLWVRVMSFLEFGYAWSKLTLVSHAWFQACTSRRYWNSITQLKLGRNFPQIFELGVFFKRLTSLKTADFSADPRADTNTWLLTNHVTAISDHVIRNLGYCKKLETLDLSKCEAITDSGFLYIAASCHNLREVLLTDCTKITNKSLQHLAFGCPLLTKLSLKGCYQITDQGINQLCEGCGELEILTLRRCRYITDRAVQSMAAHLHRLKSLDLYSCHRITDMSLKYLAEHSKKLESLVVGSCPKVGDYGVKLLSKGCERIRVLDLFQTGVTTEGIGACAGLENLMRLNLYNTKITRGDLVNSNVNFASATVFI